MSVVQLTAHATYATGTKNHLEAARTHARLAEMRAPEDHRRMIDLIEAFTEFVLEQCAHGGGADDDHERNVRAKTQTLGKTLLSIAVDTKVSRLIRITTMFVEIVCARGPAH